MADALSCPSRNQGGGLPESSVTPWRAPDFLTNCQRSQEGELSQRKPQVAGAFLSHKPLISTAEDSHLAPAYQAPCPAGWEVVERHPSPVPTVELSWRDREGGDGQGPAQREQGG